MNFKPVTLSFFIFFLGISSHVNAQEIVETPPPSEFVYIQKSKTGTLVDSKDDYYTLTLKGNHLHLIYFADQPERITGEEVLSVFFDSWKSLDPAKNRQQLSLTTLCSLLRRRRSHTRCIGTSKS